MDLTNFEVELRLPSELNIDLESEGKVGIHMDEIDVPHEIEDKTIGDNLSSVYKIMSQWVDLIHNKNEGMGFELIELP